VYYRASLEDSEVRFGPINQTVRAGLESDVQRYIKICHDCQCMRKEVVVKAPTGLMPAFCQPFKQVAVDVVRSFPREKYKYIDI